MAKPGRKRPPSCFQSAPTPPAGEIPGVEGPPSLESKSRPAGLNGSWTVPGVCCFLALATWLVFGQTLRFEFVNYDDDVQVYAVPQIENGLTLNGFLWAFTHRHYGHWIPLNTISHMLDSQLYGLEAGGHHFTNVLLHAASAILLFLVLRRMTGSHLARRVCGSGLCRSSVARGISRVGVGTQGRVERFFLHADALDIRALCAKPVKDQRSGIGRKPRCPSHHFPPLGS